MIRRLKNRFTAMAYQLYLFCHSCMLVDPKSPSLVVSLTSYPARFNIVYWTIKSLMVQTLKPCHVILYLNKDVAMDSLPNRLLRMKKYGLEIKCICEDIKPHKKYFYAMQEFPDCAIITLDDDVMYDTKTIENLYMSYKKYPDCVSAKRVAKMTKNENGEINKYNLWLGEYVTLFNPSHSLFATGVGGVLYPPSCFCAKWFNTELIKEYCLNADDVWLKYLEIVHDCKVVFVPGKKVHPYSCRVKSGLQNSNVGLSQNDVYIKNLADFFGFDLAYYINDANDWLTKGAK